MEKPTRGFVSGLTQTLYHLQEGLRTEQKNSNEPSCKGRKQCLPLVLKTGTQQTEHLNDYRKDFWANLFLNFQRKSHISS